MHLRQLEYLRLVIDKGSYAAAAQAAGVTQSAVTQALQALERELGLALFERIGRKKVATRAALAVARRAADVHDNIAAMGVRSPDAGLDASATPRAMLHLGMSPAAALLYGPTIERTWRAEEPDGVLHIAGGSAPELLAGLAGGELDLVVVPRPRRYQVPGIRRMPLHTSTPVVYCRTGHPLQAAQTLAGIADAPWAVTGATGTPGNQIEEALRVRGLRLPRIMVHCSDYATLLNLVAQTDMLCVIPHPALLAGVNSTGVRALNITEGLPQYEVSAFWRPAGPKSRTSHVQKIVDALRVLADANR